MSLTQALSQGAQVMVIGLVIVFSVLLILMLVMMLMKVIFYKPQAKAKPQPSAPETPPAPAAPPAPAPMDDGELVAVLTAAVAASLNTSTYRLQIKSYRRIENHAPAWNKAGLRDVIDARF